MIAAAQGWKMGFVFRQWT